MSDVFKRYYIFDEDEKVAEVDAVNEEAAMDCARNLVGEHASVVEKS